MLDILVVHLSHPQIEYLLVFNAYWLPLVALEG